MYDEELMKLYEFFARPVSVEILESAERLHKRISREDYGHVRKY